jgi:hypothetical protein
VASFTKNLTTKIKNLSLLYTHAPNKNDSLIIYLCTILDKLYYSFRSIDYNSTLKFPS